jgi:hypothetical protein
VIGGSDAFGSSTGSFQSAGENPGDGLPMVENLGGEEGLVPAVGSGVAFAGDV